MVSRACVRGWIVSGSSSPAWFHETGTHPAPPSGSKAIANLTWAFSMGGRRTAVFKFSWFSLLTYTILLYIIQHGDGKADSRCERVSIVGHSSHREAARCRVGFHLHTNRVSGGLKSTRWVVAEHAARGTSLRRGTRCAVDGHLIGSARRSRSSEFGFFDDKYDKYERVPKNPEFFSRQVWSKYGKVWCKVWRLIGFDGRRSLRGRAFQGRALERGADDRM
jgi:hypothetical protein